MSSRCTQLLERQTIGHVASETQNTSCWICICPGCYAKSNFDHFLIQLFSMSRPDFEWERAYEINGVSDKVLKLLSFTCRTVGTEL
ncbi:hypothetical protein T4A_1506 [Trichinella pseudospiralis]|uniref:Uncharacterized protein n=1 Tax=Trichinella pseudospiralis TaxID=6337 RepID=A0A0V1F2E9_TRIPS|nr:hypothetical protein T4A_1506 [Trichinella pseudospiralis]